MVSATASMNQYSNGYLPHGYPNGYHLTSDGAELNGRTLANGPQNALKAAAANGQTPINNNSSANGSTRVNGTNSVQHGPLVDFDENRCILSSPTAMPLAAGFLWNTRMMIHMTARGYATAQFMQPEPSKYAHAQIMEAKHFMLPEQGTYAHHPGRFFFVKDRDSGALFSAPYEPSRAPVDSFNFKLSPTDIQWEIKAHDVRVEITLSLPVGDAVELWEVKLSNVGSAPRRLGFYPAFPLGLVSWMDQSAAFDADLNAVVADSTTPYQKVNDYFKHKALQLKDKVFLISEQAPQAYETRQAAFEGEGGLHRPDGITMEKMACGNAGYENPIAAMQFDHDLAGGASVTHRFLFGPAYDREEIVRIKDSYLSEAAFAAARAEYAAYIDRGTGAVHLESPDPHFDAFVNTWLPRQVYYHGDTNRLSTDPQTRNFLQDAIGCVYLRPDTSRATLLKALTQQHKDGSMPDGIKLYEGAELKYINTVPHMDHSVWLPLFMETYLDETDDYEVLDEVVENKAEGTTMTVRERIDAAMRYLTGPTAVDARGLHYISQGDWNDPMNMVGWKGKGVSGWLTIATTYALRLWGRLCFDDGRDGSEFMDAAERLSDVANEHLWDGNWYARGITDDGNAFGVAADEEGRIYLNPQSFALMSGIADDDQTQRIVSAVEEQLAGPYGVEMLGPAYTHMRDDVGRLTQKYPGVAENGAVYNHAAAFYAWALFPREEQRYKDVAHDTLRSMLVGPDPADYTVRGQLPIFVPNYFRGARRTHPRDAGRSSHLFNTGTASWAYRCALEGLLGLRGCRAGLRIAPNLPAAWPGAHATRHFRGATFDVRMRRAQGAEEPRVECDGYEVPDGIITGVEAGKTYSVQVVLPMAQ